jgi:hypothetical protein
MGSLLDIDRGSRLNRAEIAYLAAVVFAALVATTIANMPASYEHCYEKK